MARKGWRLDRDVSLLCAAIGYSMLAIVAAVVPLAFVVMIW